MIDGEHSQTIIIVDDEEMVLTSLNSLFAARDLAEAMGIRRKLAEKMAYCLCKANVIELKGKRGRANLYSLRI